MADDAFAEIDRIASGQDKPKEGAKPAPKAEEKEDASANLTSSKSKESPTSGASSAENSSSSTDVKTTPQKPVAAAELRKAYENLKSEHARLKEEHTKLKDFKPPEDTEKKALAERVEAHTKRISELEAELRYSNYERSEEYKTKYHEPFVEAYQAGRAKVASLKVADAEGETRQGTAADFDNIMRIQDDETAAEKATEMFGAKASIVLYHRERVQELNAARAKAVEEYRKSGDERERQRLEQQTLAKTTAEKQAGEIAGMFKTFADEAIEKYPQWFKPEEGDDKGNELLVKGFERADLAFKSSPFQPNLTPQERDGIIRLHTAIRNKAAGFDRLVYKNTQLSNRVKELETKLAEFENSKPTGGIGKAKSSEASFLQSVDEEIDALAAARG